MFSNGRTTIAVLVCDSTSYYQQMLCKTLSKYGKRAGYNVAFFSCFSTYGINGNNAIGEFNILNLPPYEQFDAIIVCPDTFDTKHMEQLQTYLDTRSRGPVVCIRRQLGDYPSVLVDDSGSIKEMVDHFHHVHHFNRIAFMTGTKGHPDSISRFEAYKTELQALGLPFDEALVYEGDFWNNKSKAAAHYFMEELETPPEAIICANDYMAISLASELILAGYMVPDDVAVSGYDNIAETLSSMPPITTISASPEAMAKQALNMVRDLLAEKEIPTIQCIPTSLYIRASCGCEATDIKTFAKARVEQIREQNKLYNQIVHNTFLSIHLESIVTCEEIGNHLMLLNSPDNHMENFHICLGEVQGKTYPKYHSSRASYPKKSYSIYSFVNRTEIKTKPFNTTNLIPAEAITEEPMSYFFFPLHYIEYTLGYIAITYDFGYIAERTFPNWLAIIGNALENLRISNKNTQLVDTLNNLYIHDALTGLYNRRGFQQASEKLFSQSKRKEQTVMIIGMDMDNLKTINDTYGHEHGDIALKAIGDALIFASQNNEICARVGGDEFSVIGTDYDEEKVQSFLSRFQQYLDEWNEDSIYEYSVAASYGVSLSSENPHLDLSEYIRLSDKRLYEQKHKKKGLPD